MYELFDKNVAKDHSTSKDVDKVVHELHIDEAAVSEVGKRILKTLVTEYSDIFSKNDEDIGKTRLLKHHINT